jgi:hypothetical protein
MSSLRETIATWANQRIEEMLSAPRMWGSLEAVELQVLQLLEIRALALRPTQELENPRRVLDTYMAFLRQRFPTQPSDPLFRLVDHLGETEFREALSEFRSTLARTILVENPFEHSELAIKLTFDVGRHPSTSAFTGYYEEFRRAARAAVRTGDKGTGRAKKDIERATDFTLEDTIVSQPNGSAGEVLLRLGPGAGQKSWEADDRVRDALSTIMTLAEWASTASDVSDLPVDDIEQRTRTAVQALRLLPRRGVKTAALGGKFVARPKPVEIRSEHEKRFLEVVGAEATPEPFDERDEIRALDLDRGLLVLGKRNRTQCFVRRELLGEVAAVGVEARVVGDRYRPLGGRPFVLATDVEVEEPPAD